MTLTVGATVGGAVWLSLRAAREALAEDVFASSVRTMEYAVDQVEVMPGPLSIDEVAQAFREIESAAAEVESLSLVTGVGDEQRVEVATGQVPGEVALGLAEQAMRENRVVVLEEAGVVRVAAPVRRDGVVAAAVVARADLQALINLQQRALASVGWFALVAAIVLVAIVDLLGRRLVYEPIQQMRDTFTRVGEGDLTARAAVARPDELGEVAQGLNEMLARLENFNDALQQLVNDATTELKQRNRQLVESYSRVFALREQLAGAEQLAAVGQTAANVAHQVGTPLNLISGYVQMLKEEVGPASPLLARLRIVEEQVAKVTETVQTVLDRSRRIGPRARMPVGALIGRVCEAVQPKLDAARVTLVGPRGASEMEILADSTSLELALLNFFSNAVDAMPDGGTLTIDVAPAGDARVRVSVRDTGQGIAPELLPRIFEPWVTTKQPGLGSGLGLAIARQVVTAHGGSIDVESAPGQGTTFTIDLPTALAVARQERQPA
ncbi:MAG: ATP-binding protein [Acidobacteriota bacterium]